MGAREEAAVSAIRARPRGEAGFTLLELIVTLLILALAAGLVAPAIGRSMEGVRARADVAHFAALLRHAHQLAIAERTTESVTIEPAAHLLTIRTGGPDDDVKESHVLPGRLSIAAIGSPAEASLAGTATSVPIVRFDAQGTSSGGEFQLASGRVRYAVSVDALTGRVRSLRR